MAEREAGLATQRSDKMTEEDYDREIAPELLKLAEKIRDMGGSIVTRVEWAPEEAAIVKCGIRDETSIAQRMTLIAALCKGNFDLFHIEMRKRFDISKTLVGNVLNRMH